MRGTHERRGGDKIPPVRSSVSYVEGLVMSDGKNAEISPPESKKQTMSCLEGPQNDSLASGHLVAGHRGFFLPRPPGVSRSKWSRHLPTLCAAEPVTLTSPTGPMPFGVESGAMRLCRKGRQKADQIGTLFLTCNTAMLVFMGDTCFRLKLTGQPSWAGPPRFLF